ncbi:mothers against decapentaplegic homolog 6-like [Limulus polyphemus]|uniref:Mothers against decapentaplegic homolog n=1 Tax=Limulus polyphemus TaxID=6850 RepID=A0ABM1BWP0_LIMPO|nr:mothers against decapentaplegic homolog 6-like [Limulus polyphemus]
MFRPKRNALVKRLWKYRIVNNTGEDEAACALENHEDFEMKSVVHSVLKRLKEAQLEKLVQSVESRGADISDCVLVPRGNLRFGRRTAAPHVLCCQLWRWPEVRHPFELKRLHWCQTANDPLYICCNPYHWSKLCEPESPPPPYRRYPQELLKPEDRAPSEPVSLETGGTNQYGSYRSHSPGDVSGVFPSQQLWCTLAYWELRSRVGRLFPVHKNAVDVFYDLPHGDGLCVSALTEQNQNDGVLRTRQKIGLGLTLTREEDGVWVYNRSDFSLFVNSPTLDLPHTRPLTVHKVLPGCSIKIFDYEKSRYYQRFENVELSDGPFNHNAVRISFAKGWGPKYTRQCITSCPSWLEVIISVVR